LIATRRGARRLVDVPPETLLEIELGHIDTANHIEQMAVSMENLFRSVEPSLRHRAEELRGLPFISSLRAAGNILFEERGKSAYVDHVDRYRDLPRGWQAFAIDADSALDLAQALSAATVFADDDHFAVREWAWLGFRRHVLESPRDAVRELAQLARHPSPFVRRFSVEASRPRSVWGVHVGYLKMCPDVIEPTLLALVGETHPYVIRSIVNWIRDASRQRPDWAHAMTSALLTRVDEPQFRQRLLALTDVAAG